MIRVSGAGDIAPTDEGVTSTSRSLEPRTQYPWDEWHMFSGMLPISTNARMLFIRIRDLLPDWGLRVEAWYCGRWIQVFTPDNINQPSDELHQLLAKIRNEHQREGTENLSKTVTNLVNRIQRRQST